MVVMAVAGSSLAYDMRTTVKVPCNMDIIHQCQVESPFRERIVSEDIRRTDELRHQVHNEHTSAPCECTILTLLCVCVSVRVNHLNPAWRKLIKDFFFVINLREAMQFLNLLIFYKESFLY